MVFDYITILGGVLVLLGILACNYARQVNGWSRAQRIASGILFIVIGFGLIGPVFRNGRPSASLNLQIDEIDTIRIYAEGGQGEPLVQTDSHELLSEWVNILPTCKYRRLNHPLYEAIYVVEVERRTGNLDYKLKLDSRQPNTVDLEPFERIDFLSLTVELTEETYQCDGLFDFVSKMLRWAK